MSDQAINGLDQDMQLFFSDLLRFTQFTDLCGCLHLYRQLYTPDIGFGIYAGMVNGETLCRMFKQAVRGVTTETAKNSRHLRNSPPTGSFADVLPSSHGRDYFGQSLGAKNQT